MYFLCFSQRRWTDEQRCCMWRGMLYVVCCSRAPFVLFFLPTLIYYQVYFVWIVCSILTIATPQDNQCWWVWAAFALKMKPLPHTHNAQITIKVSFVSLPILLAFWRFIQTIPSIRSSPDNTFNIYSPPYVVFFPLKRRILESLYDALFHIMTVSVSFLELDGCDGYEKECHKSSKLL